MPIGFKAKKIENSQRFYYYLNFNDLNKNLLKKTKKIKILIQDSQTFNEQFQNKYINNLNNDINKFSNKKQIFSDQIKNKTINDNIFYSVENKKNNNNKLYEILLNENANNYSEIKLSFDESEEIKQFSTENQNYFIYFMDIKNNIISSFNNSENFINIFNNAEIISVISYYRNIINEFVESYEIYYDSTSKNKINIRNINSFNIINNSDLDNLTLTIYYRKNIEKILILNDITKIQLNSFTINRNISDVLNDLLNENDLDFSISLKYNLQQTNQSYDKIKQFKIKKQTNSLYTELKNANINDFINIVLNKNNDYICELNDNDIYSIEFINKSKEYINYNLVIKSILFNNEIINNIYFDDLFQNEFIYSFDNIKNNFITKLYFQEYFKIDDPFVSIEFALFDKNRTEISSKIVRCKFKKNKKQELFNNKNILNDFNKLIKDKIKFDNLKINLNLQTYNTFNLIEKVRITNISDFANLAFYLNYINQQTGKADIEELFNNTLIKINIVNKIKNRKNENNFIYKVSELFSFSQNGDLLTSNEILLNIFNNQKINKLIVGDEELTNLFNNKIQKKNIENIFTQEIKLNFLPLEKNILLYKNKGKDKLDNIINDTIFIDIGQDQKNNINFSFYNMFYQNKKMINFNYDIYNKLKDLYCETDIYLVDNYTKKLFELFFVYNFKNLVNEDNIFIISKSYYKDDLINSSLIVEKDDNELININKSLLDLSIVDEEIKFIDLESKFYLNNTINDNNFNNNLNIEFNNKNKIKLSINDVLNNFDIENIDLNEINVKLLTIPIIKQEINSEIDYYDTNIIDVQNINNINYIIPSEKYINTKSINFNDMFLGYNINLNNLNFDLTNMILDINLQKNSDIFNNFIDIQYNMLSEFFEYCKTYNFLIIDKLVIRAYVSLKINDQKIENIINYNILNKDNMNNKILDLNKISIIYN